MKKILWTLIFLISAVIVGFVTYRSASIPSNEIRGGSSVTDSNTESASPKSQTIVDLKDGDSYTFTLQNKKQTIAGREVDALTYNGIVTGPTIRVKQDSTIRLTLKNNLDRATTSQEKPRDQERTALDILKDRYAKGEINKEEFETKKKDLTS